MELTTDQALQQAIEAHKAGKLQDAEGLYRAILTAQPMHPDANHNLGVMAVSLNKTEAALPLFKIALEANPNQGQFWISYIDALIKEKQFDNASNVLEQGKKRGLAGENVDILEAQLTAIILAQNSETSRSPPQTELNTLLDYYQKGQYELAQILAKTLTQQYPNHPFGWKALGVLFKQLGKLEDSVIATQKALEISPNDAEAQCNLGVTLTELGRLEDAETSFKKAIAYKPDYAEAHDNLGNMLQKLGRLKDAETSYNKAIAIKPDYAQAHSNLGNTLKELGRLEDAETSYNKAIAIKPVFAEAHSNLGIALQELGRLEDAETSYNKAIAIKPDYAEAYSNLGNTLKELGRLEDAETSYNKAIAIKPDYAQAHSNLGNTLKELGRLEDAETSYNKAIAIKPDYAEAYSNLGNTLKELGRLEDAVTSYNKAIAIKPDYAEAYSNLGLLLMQTGDLEGPRNTHERAIKLDSKKWSIHYNYSTYLYEIGDLDSAIDSMKRAQFSVPKNKFKLVDVCLKAIYADKNTTQSKGSDTYQPSVNFKIGLRSDPFILSRPVEKELIAHLYQMNYRILDKALDGRYGNGKCSIDFDLFYDKSQIIKVIAKDLTKICRDAVASEVHIYDSFFNIYSAGAGTKIHNHITSNDKHFDLSKRKYSLVYYLDVGDQNGLEPGVLRLFDPDQDIVPSNGMIVIINANKKHHALYDGKTDRIMIGVNFYSI